MDILKAPARAPEDKRCGKNAMKSENWHRASRLEMWGVAITVAFLTINLAQIERYGMSWDEPAIMERGRQTVALVRGLASSGASDEFFFTPIHFHPPFYATCNYGFSKIMTRLFGWESLPAGHFLNLLIASGGLIVVFYLGKHMFNATVGFAAMVLIIFFPRFIAHAHFNAKDIPVMVFGTLTLFLLYLAAKRNQRKYWILACLSFACSVTTKLDGLFVLPIFLIPWLATIFRANSATRFAQVREMGLFIYGSILLIFLLWPELWLNPLQILSSVSHFSGSFVTLEVPYLGRNYPANGMPWHYLPMHFLAVTPVVLLIVIGLGAVCSLRKLVSKNPPFEHALLWCWIMTPVIPRMFPGNVQYDGMRHVFLIVPALALLGGVWISELLLCCTKKLRLVTICSMAMGWLTWQTLQCHPHEAFYLNEIVRSIVPGSKLGEYYDFQGWGSIFGDAVDWLNVNAQPNSSVTIWEDNYLPTRYHFRNDLRWAPGGSEDADYFIVGGWRRDFSPSFHAALIFSVHCYGADLLHLYRRERENAASGSNSATE